MDIKIDLVYTINIFTLNYESFVPLQLKNHFLDLEKFIISFVIWQNASILYNN